MVKEPRVTCVVMTHLSENAHYLKACLDSLAAQSRAPDEVFVISSAESAPENVPEAFKIIWDKTLNTSSKKDVFGISIAHPDTTHFWIISDDLVLSPNSLEALLEMDPNGELIQSPMSNNDNGALFFTRMPVGPSSDFDEGLVDWTLTLPPTKPILFFVPWIPFYCIMIPKRVWEHVGPLDERLDVRHNDQDYCYRARIGGVITAVNTGAFALHFGTKTLKKAHNDEEFDEATRVFNSKYNLKGAS